MVLLFVCVCVLDYPFPSSKDSLKLQTSSQPLSVEKSLFCIKNFEYRTEQYRSSTRIQGNKRHETGGHLGTGGSVGTDGPSRRGPSHKSRTGGTVLRFTF